MATFPAIAFERPATEERLGVHQQTRTLPRLGRTPPEGRDCFFQSSLTKARIPLTAIWSIAP
jgi:hypothetical protein